MSCLSRPAARAAAVVLIVLFAALITPGALADALSEGRALYKAGDYPAAVARLEQATREDPRNAKAWWQLNFAYNKLSRYADALRAAEQADRVDPKHGFASEPGKYAEVVGRLRSKVGAPAPAGSNRPSSRPSTGSIGASGAPAGDLVRRLTSGSVYVAPGMGVDTARLERVARDLRPTVVKFAVLNSRSGSATLSREADRIRRYLSIGNGYVIMASRAAVAASGAKLSQATLRDLTRRVAPQMQAGDYAGGLERLARDLVRTRREQTTGTLVTWLVIVGVIVGAIVLWVVFRGLANARAMRARREPLERLKGEVVGQMSYLDGSLAVADAATAARIRDARVAAGTKLDEASRIMATARGERDMNRAQSLLDQALTDLAAARAAADRAAEGGPASPAQAAASQAGAAADAASGAPPRYPAADERTDWTQVPENERGVCFFCSRPARMRELTPVTVNLEGEDRRVLACPDDLATVRSGAAPRIRAFEQDGRYVPWYAYDRYDPYRDYDGAGSVLSNLVTLSLIDRMFWGWRHPAGWSWGGGYGGWGGGYPFYVDHSHYRDWQSDRAAAAVDFGAPDHAAGTDFLQADSALDDASGPQAGGTDFLGSDAS